MQPVGAGSSQTEGIEVVETTTGTDPSVEDGGMVQVRDWGDPKREREVMGQEVDPSVTVEEPEYPYPEMTREAPPTVEPERREREVMDGARVKRQDAEESLQV